MDIRGEIQHKLKISLEGIVEDEVLINVSIPERLDKGDFTSNCALVYFSKLKAKSSKSPVELAEELVSKLHKDGSFSANFEKIEVAKPGFINFFMSSELLSTKLMKALSEQKKVAVAIKTQKLVFEFGDPNPFKEPHIGHLRGFALGEALSRLMERSGKDVIRASYQGDVGLHVAKAIWGMEKLGIGRVEVKSLDERIKYLGKAYALGASEYENNEAVKKEIASINTKLYQKDPDLKEVWEKGRAWSLEYFEQLYTKLGIKYDKYYFESETAPLGKEIVEKNSPKVFQKHDDAYIFRGEPFGLHTRVFVTKEDYATYEGKDLALAVLKKKDFGGISSIIMTANEQAEYFKVILKALSLIDKDLGEKTSHLSFGFVNLKEGKMSSRTGNIVSAFWLLDETKKRISKSFKKVDENVLEQLAVGAVKWSMLKFSRESDISFSFEDSISVEGNSGPYLQYTYARTQSILAKKSEAKKLGALEGSELALARSICQFETYLSDAAITLSPNLLTNYLFHLCQDFNSFYEKEKIVGSDKEEQRLLLVKAVAKVLKDGLYLLGIDTPSRI